jgi:hypothetical protein
MCPTRSSGSKHATELQVHVTATVGGSNFELLATEYGSTGNYQVQNRRDNKAFFAHLKTLGADVSYITLQKDFWTQVVGPRTSFNLNDTATKYFTSFTLRVAPAPPPNKK